MYTAEVPILKIIRYYVWPLELLMTELRAGIQFLVTVYS
jgi:hypothetical protein